MRGYVQESTDGWDLQPSLIAAIELAVRIFGSIFVLIATGLIIYVAQGGDVRVGLASAVAANGQAILITIIFSGAPIVNLIVTRYRIDEDGVMMQSQLFQKTEQRVGWEKVTALEERRGLLGTIFGFSELVVVAYGSRGAKIHVRGVRDVAALRERLAEKMAEAVSIPAILQSD